MSNLEKIVDTLSSLTMMEAADLKDMLKVKWNIKDIAPVMAASSAPAAAATVQEKTQFDVVLVSIGDKKIEVIKLVKNENEGFDLTKAKAMVDTPSAVIKSGISKADAEALKAKFEGVGATVEIR